MILVTKNREKCNNFFIIVITNNLYNQSLVDGYAIPAICITTPKNST